MTPRTGTDRQPPAHASPRCWADARHYPRYALSVFVVRRAEPHVEQLILIVGLQMQNRRQNRQRCQWLRAGAQNGRARGRQHQPCVYRVPDHAVRSVSAQGCPGWRMRQWPQRAAEPEGPGRGQHIPADEQRGGTDGGDSRQPPPGFSGPEHTGHGR